MTPRRSIEQDDQLERSAEVAALETARSAAESSAEKPAGPKKEEEHMSLFWRVFGGTILSIVALVSITLFNNMSSSITELRAEISREREARAELVKKEEYSSRVTSLYERIRGFDALKVEMEGVKEKVRGNGAALDDVKRETAAALDAAKKDASATEVLKEKVAALEGVKKEVAVLDLLKERLAAAAVDLKTVRDDLTRLTGEVEKNKTSDLERKSIRDAQYKQVEEALKEFQKALQDCREKLARLEGAKPAPKQSDGEK